MEYCLEQKIYDVVIVGAGAVGVESATMAKHLGFDTIILEKGEDIAYNMSRFSHLDMFSPWSYNYSPLGISILKQKGIFKKPQNEYEQTHDYIKNYLKPLAKVQKLNIKYNTQVQSIAKSQITKTDMMGDNREKYLFRLLIETGQKEWFIYAKHVIDASGVYDNPLYFGEGRMAAINEKKHQNSIHYQAIDKEKLSEKFRSKTTLLIGTTCCMAKSVAVIKKFMDEDDTTKIIYVDETGLKPYIHQLKNDIFKKRVEVINNANELLDSFYPQVKVLKKSSIYAIEKNQNGFEVFLNAYDKQESFSVSVDNIVSNCGFEADNSIYKQLQVHECYASHAPMNLAANMLEDTIDCRFTKYSTQRKNRQNK